MIKYGLISDVDSGVIEKTLDIIVGDGDYFPIHITEIGLFDCGTAKGIYGYLQDKKSLLDNDIVYTGIDNEKDKPISPPEWLHYINGNSNEVYNQIEDNSQHLIFIDGCHCFAHVVSDFFCYAPKVKVGGYVAFHDTGKHIQPLKDFQHGDKENPDAYISCRKALERIGLLPIKIESGENAGYELILSGYKGWELIFDEADPSDLAGGICVFKKLY